MITDDGYKRLFHFFLWCCLGFLISIIGISNVFAYTYNYVADIPNVTMQLVETDYASSPIQNPFNSAYAFGQVLRVDYLINNYSFSADTNYQLETHLPNQVFTNADTYSVQGLNGETCMITYNLPNTIMNNDNYPRWAFQCPHATTSITISIWNSASQYLWSGTDIFKWSSAVLSSSTSSMGGSGTSTDNIINNNNQNTQSIINNQNQNTQDIINNQNQNTQDIIDSQQVCMTKDYDKNDIKTENMYLNSSGVESPTTGWGISDYIKFTGNITILNYSTNVAGSICFYNNSKTLISCQTYRNVYDNGLTVPSNAIYMRFSIQTSNNVPRLRVNTCSTGNQIIAEQNEEAETTRKGILAKIKELFSWFSNDDDADISGLDNMVGWLPPGPVDSIINLPLAFFNALTNTLSGTCQNVTLNVPFVNQTLTLYCFDSYMSQYLTNFNTLWTLVGSIVSIFILYNYLLALYKWVDDTLTFRENNMPGYYGDNWGGGA